MMQFMIRKEFFKNSIVFTWLFSYLIILIIPTIATFSIYFITKQTLQNEIVTTNELMLRQFQQKIDNIILNMDTVGKEIVLNDRLKQFITNHDRNNPQMQYDLIALRSDLSTYPSSNSSINSFFIYINNMQLIITPDLSTDFNSYYEMALHEYSTLDFWQSTLSATHSGQFVPVRKGNNSSHIAYVKSWTFSETPSIQATLVIMLDQETLLNDIDPFLQNSQSDICIVDKENQIILSNQPYDPNFFMNLIDFQQDNYPTKITLDEVEAMLTAIPSEITSWKYTFITPSEVLWKKLESIRILSYLLLGLSIVLGFLMTFYYISKNYRPINRLMTMLRTQVTTNVSGTKNEYIYMENSISNILERKKELESSINLQQKELKKNYLVHLINGDMDSLEEISKRLELYKIHLVSDYFGIVLFDLNKYNSLFSDDDITENERFQLYKLIISNITHEMIGEKYLNYMVDVNGFLVCIINPLTDQNYDIKAIVTSAKDYIIRNFHVDISAAISNLHDTVFGIHSAYSEALDILEYNRMMGITEITALKNTEAPYDYNYGFTLEKEQQLIHYIKTGNIEMARDIVCTIFDTILKQQQPPMQIIQCFIFDMVATIIKTIPIINNAQDLNHEKEIDFINQLMNSTTVAQMQEVLLSMISSICPTPEKSLSSNGLITDIMEYIEQNYTDVNLSPTLVGEHFQLTSSYLSNIFKDKTNYSIFYYIHYVRITHAKKLLAETNKKIEEIISMVGYTNRATFSRFFKKFEGITAGKYREIHSNR